MPANATYGYAFWQGEVEKSVRADEPLATGWQESHNFYSGEPLDAMPDGEFVNINVDFYETEQKVPQLFFESPELQFGAGAGFEQMSPGIVAFKKLVNAILGPDYIDALETVLISLKRCSMTSGRGATIIGYQPTMVPVATPEPVQQPGAVLGLSQPAPPPTPVPIHEAWFWDEISDKKFRKPADFTSTNFDKAPWLGMDFRVPLRSARGFCTIPPDFEGTKTVDDKVLTSGTQPEESGLAYVDGTIIWYKASLFDDDEIHPEIYRRHILIDGLEAFADKTDPEWRSPYQTKMPNGRLRADSMIGNPIHVFTLRAVPDSSNPASDAKMRRSLVKEVCAYRGDMVDERGVNKPKFGYNAEVIPPDAIEKITQAIRAGSLIALPAAAFQGGLDNNFRLLSQGTSPRQNYAAMNQFSSDIAKTSGIDATGAGVNDGEEETATKTSEIAKARNVRLDAERKRVLRQYLKAVDGKIAPMVLRFCSDQTLVAELIGPEATQAYLAWRAQVLEMGDLRPKFTAKPDSQIKLDAAAEFKLVLQAYNFIAKDPLAGTARVVILRKIFELRGWDPALIADQPPDNKPEMSFGFSFKGDDLNPLNAQQPIVMSVLAQGGITIEPQTLAEAQDGAKNQIMLEQLVASQASAQAGKKTPQQHGGLADKMGPLSKQDSEQTGNRPGPSVQ